MVTSGAALAVAGGGLALTRHRARETGPTPVSTNVSRAPASRPRPPEPSDAIPATNEVELNAAWRKGVEQKDWQRALQIAQWITALGEEKSSGWLMQAYCLHELNCTEEAFELLGGVIEKFPDEEMPAYNLACYASQVGKLDEARRWLKKAMQAGDAAEVKTKALADADLQPIWPDIKQM